MSLDELEVVGKLGLSGSPRESDVVHPCRPHIAALVAGLPIHPEDGSR